jgi:NADP-dependent 3-hydroxy acid dehydrogenase YdfG
MSTQKIFVTGATAGFGKAIAIKFAQHNWDVIINGRRTERLTQLEEELKSNYNVKVLSLPFDVRDNSEVELAVKNMPSEWKEIDVLVNNAGLAAGLGLIQDGSLEDWNTMIDTNIKGLLHVSKAIMPLMIQRQKGHIINIGSLAGREAYLRGNVYCATKFAVDALTKSMRIDLLEHGIKVTSVNPGAAETEFSITRLKGDVERAKAVYNGYQPLVADDIADVVYFAATRPPHVVLNDILITPLAQANTSHLIRKQ